MLTKRQDEIAKQYAKLAKELERYPSHSDLLKVGIKRNHLRDHFGDMDGLRDKARGAYPKSFENIVDPEHYSNEALQKLKEKVKKHRRFVITTAVAGAPVDSDALAAIDTYCKQNKALLLILPANYALYDLPADLVAERDIVFRDLKLNSNITISTIKIDPKQVDPILGLDVFAHREGTTLIGSPKQRMRPIANSNTKIPHILQATGAITKPRYVPRDGAPKRRDTLATKQHVMGAIIVEILDDKLYAFRQVQFDRDGSFIDLFVKYDSEGTEPVQAEAVVQGDFHDGETDATADAVADELCRLGRPKYRVIHDGFNGHSISHHDKHKKVLQAIKAQAGRLSLGTEMHNYKLSLGRKLKLAEQTGTKLLITKSNHDEFLIRYLEDGEFDDHNRLLSTKLQVHAMEGRDPLEHGLADMGLKSDRIIWLSRDQDFKVTRQKIEIGCHGDLGANGKRNPGSAGMFKAYGDCSYGHCHFPEINHGAMSVGTSSMLKLEYNRGPSSWMHAHQVIYPNGSRQIIISINGKYRLKD